jgi:hypothetical protein
VPRLGQFRKSTQGSKLLFIFITALFLLTATKPRCILATLFCNSRVDLFESYEKLFINNPRCYCEPYDVINTYLNIQEVETKFVLNSGSKLTCKLSNDCISRRQKSKKRQICFKTPFFHIKEAFVEL